MFVILFYVVHVAGFHCLLGQVGVVVFSLSTKLC